MTLDAQPYCEYGIYLIPIEGSETPSPGKIDQWGAIYGDEGIQRLFRACPFDYWSKGRAESPSISMESHAPPAQPNGTRVQMTILAGPGLFPGCMGIHPGNGQTNEGLLYSPTQPEVADKILSAGNDYHNP